MEETTWTRAKEVFDRVYIFNPYPTKHEMQDLARSTGVAFNQVKCWFTNKRRRSPKSPPKRWVPTAECVDIESRDPADILFDDFLALIVV